MEQLITVFAGARDHYQFPVALHERGRLECHVAEWYSPLDSPAVRFIVRRSPRLSRTLGKRYHPALPSSRVIVPAGGWLKGMARLLPLGKLRASPATVDAALGGCAGKLARERHVGLLSTSYYAYYAFRAMGTASAHARLLYQIHPHPLTLRRIFNRELATHPDSAASLLGEQEMAPSGSRRLEQLAMEPMMADRCIATSSFTKRSLVENGVAAAQVAVVPLGVDLERFQPGERDPGCDFRVLFVGSPTQRKGIKYLLEAWERLALPRAELIICGRGFADTPLLARHGGRFTQHTNVAPEGLVRLYQTADVFCLPSLAEGFGLVILEALACGTPVVTTTSTAGADIIPEGRAGFVIGPGDVEALMERLKWCHDERDGKLRAMRPA
ncbi:MAG: glycosyltransferase family 4 protein, partial [Chloroflexota bacterium]|nr:glycosyltransferase family 4 protein [Chloroflexota bacterium]